jgi:glycosyltransferase involved in cell wall biosynthesis
MCDISVIIPNYNGAAFLKEAIDSALQQKDLLVEVIVVDDGSSDRSREILKGYGNRIRVFYQDNKGAPVARNLGLKYAKADFIKFLDSDDVLSQGSLLTELKISEKLSEQDICFGEIFFIDQNGAIIDAKPKLRTKNSEESSLAYFLKNNPLTSSPLHRRAQLMSIGGFKELPKGQEWDLHLRLFLKGYKFHYHQNFVYSFRIHDSEKRYSHLNISSAGRLTFYNIFNKQLKQIREVYPNLNKEESRLLAHRYYSYGRAILREGNKEDALIYFDKAKELAGKSAVVGSKIYKFLTSVFSPFISEKILLKVKGL